MLGTPNKAAILLMKYQYASKCYVLLVDDDRKLLQKLELLLVSEGFHVFTAASRAEALALVQQHCFHVAVIDVRLDENNPQNRDGLQLMHEIRAFDPSTGIIVLTRHLDIDVVSQAIQLPATGQLVATVYEASHSPASDFLTKVPEDLRKLPEVVARVFDEVVHINWALTVTDAENLLLQLPKRLRFANGKLPPPERLEREIEEVVRKLFVGWESVELSAISVEQQGASKAVVLRATPYKDGVAGALAIAKIGEYALIEREVVRYREHIERRVNNNRSPVAIMPVRRTRSIGGMLYTFLGMGGAVQDFAQMYHTTNDQAKINDVLNNLYADTLKHQHAVTYTYHDDADLRLLYTDLLRLDENELRKTLNELLTLIRAIRRPSNPRKFWLPNGMPLLNPVEYALTADFRGGYLETIIHGDLHAHNVLVDYRGDTWLIDFANTGRGPLLQDYITMEASLLVEINRVPEGRMMLDWSRALFAEPGEMFPMLPDHLLLHPEVVKAHETIMMIRRLALRDNPIMDMETAKHTYLVGLLFTMLRLMTVKFLNAPRRFHAMTLASGIVEVLQNFDYAAPSLLR